MDLKKRFGRLVAAHRKRVGLTQLELAGKAGLSEEMVRRIERGGTGAGFPTIEKLASAMSVDPGELFSTDIAKGALNRKPLSALTARLASLDDEQLAWVERLLDVALKGRR